MNISVIGAGYVGLVTAACFADLGNHVSCIDINEDKITKLNQGILPIYEPGLDTIIQANRAAGRLHFVTSLHASQQEPQLIFIAVGTPSNQEGAADLQYVLDAAKNIGAYLNQYCVIVDKSTVPVGMAAQVEAVIHAGLVERAKAITFDVVSNPEFLREGAAIDDFMHPDRVIIGCSSKKAKQLMLDLYLPLMRNTEKIYFMNVKDAEMTKYVANAMLATRISFMNEVAVLCEKMDVDVENVRVGVGADSRIGPGFLFPGCGYGGSCFPKDVKALIKMAVKADFDPLILRSVEKRNELQKKLLFEKLTHVFGQDL
ncbi:MAG TPA: UDP-glucose/GDP-mannose dehydrogenase family protein, partial [Gammaproteobacteria bacterium]|nr:UDP-glucose/GDP-mannose dehydrogenase family protein [Gammaproteobacteria bacterium]